MIEPSRQILWNITGRAFLDACAAVAAVSLLAGLSLRISAWLRGRKSSGAGAAATRLRAALKAACVQTGTMRNPRYLAMHRCASYGMSLLFAGSLLVAIEMHLGLRFLQGAAYLAFTLAMDCAGIAVLVGVGLAAYLRYVKRPERLESGFGDAMLLIMLGGLALSGFLVKGLRIVATSDHWAPWSPAGYAAAAALGRAMDAGQATRLHQLAWYGHAALAFTFIALMPWTKLLHLLSVPLSIFLSTPRGTDGVLPRLPAMPPAGRVTLADCSRKQLVEADACIECGRCRKLCSIYQGDIPYAPVNLMANLRKLSHRARWDSPLVHGAIQEDALWSCSACRSCEERCPMEGEHAAGIMGIRRGQVENGHAPDFAAERFARHKVSLAGAADHFTLPDSASDVVIWPGCRESEADQIAMIAAVLNLLRKAGLTATVLEPPSCCGAPMRQLGNEQLYRQHARANIDFLNAIPDATIITCCPHCFTTLKHGYRPLGADFNVVHHSQYLADLLSKGLLSPVKSKPLKTAYHDPCFLGRHNGEYDAPRQLLRAVDGLEPLEMKHSRQKSLCCGSGGGTVPGETAAANGRKWIRQALKENVEAVVTACPYCREALSSAARSEAKGKSLSVVDIAAILDSGGLS